MRFSALVYMVFLPFCGSASAALPLEAHTGLPTPEDNELWRQHEALVAAYRRTKSECAEQGRVTLVTPLNSDGNELQFDCVVRDDPRYKAQHAYDQKARRPTDLDSRLSRFVGQNVRAVVDVIGGPQGEPFENDELVYSWGRDANYTIPGTVLFDDDLTEVCEIHLVVDVGTRVVQSFKWNERRGGCQWYADLFDRGLPFESEH